MTRKTNSAEGLTNGTAVTFANSGGASGDAVTPNLGTSSTALGTTAQKAHGADAFLITPSGTDIAFLQWTGFNGSSLSLRFYIRFNGAVPTVQTEYAQIRSSSASAARIKVLSSGRWSITNASDTSMFSGSVNITADTWYRVECRIEKGTGTTDGKVDFGVFALDGTTRIETYTSTAVNVGTANLTEVRIGKTSAANNGIPFYLDDLAADDALSGMVGPYSSVNVAPTSNAGVNKTVLPGSTVGMSVTDNDSDGTVASRSLTLVNKVPSTSPDLVINNGTTANPTVTAPANSAGAVYTLKYVVTDNVGAVSPDSFASVFVPTKAARAIALVGTTEHTLIGGGDLVTNVNDGSDSTGVQYPAGSVTSKSIRYKLAPLEASTTSFSVTLRRKVDTAGNGVSKVTVYEGSTARIQWTGVDVPTTTLAAVALNLSNATVNNVASITNFNELEIEFTWGPS